MTLAFWRHGSLEIPNGFDVQDTLDLVLRQTTKVVPHHMYGKYPALYTVLAAVPVGTLGIRGMYLLNGVALAAVIVMYHRVARSLLGRQLALGSTLLLPFVVPLLPYALMGLPHLVSAALVLGALLLFFSAVRCERGRTAFALSVASGLAAGFATGVRLQCITVGGVLIAASALRARVRLPALTGQLLAQGACVGAMAILNRERFGGAPFSYGWNPIGPNPATENWHYYLTHPAVPLGVAWVASLGMATLRIPRARPSERAIICVAMASALALPALRHQLARMAATASVLLVSSNAFLHEQPSMTIGWLNKPLFAASPALILAFVGIVRAGWRRARVEIEVAAATCVAMLLLLVLRDPDPATDESVIGFMSLNPRYLVEIYPLLFLLACWTARELRFSRVFWFSAAAFAIPLAVIFTHTRDDLDPTRRFVVLSLSAGVTVLVAVAYGVYRVRSASALPPAIFGVAVAYACVITTLGDAVAVMDMTGRYELWTRRVESATPQRFLLVGWDNAKDPVYSVREDRDVVFVNAAVDDGPQLLGTLDAFRARGRPAYYFGIGLERVRPLLQARYEIVPLLSDPLLWRLDSRGDH
ncbi:MAG TPA: hypothetical protein VGH28_19995 [Polyangiaceae bacterium]